MQLFKLAIRHNLHGFATLENKTPALTFPKFPSVTDRIEIHQLQPLVWPSNLLYVMLSGCDWWISILSVNNTQDWRKVWKRFCKCFVFQSRVSTKMVVIVMWCGRGQRPWILDERFLHEWTVHCVDLSTFFLNREVFKPISLWQNTLIL